MRSFVIKLILYCLLWTINPVTAQTLPPEIKKILKQYSLPEDSISISIEQTDTEATLLDWRSEQFITPASTMKLITSYAGLELLGPDFTWKTGFYIDGPIVNDTLDSNLYIRGSGDPMLINETLEQAVIAIRETGLKDISGDLVIDNSYFQIPDHSPATLDGHWLEPYNALPDAANINFGAVEFFINPGKYSSRPTVSMNPPIRDYKVFSRMKASGGRCTTASLEPKIELVPFQGTTTVSFAGQYAKRCGNRAIYRVVAKPDVLLYSAFRQLWHKHGGTMGSQFRHGEVPASAKLVYTLISEPLIEQIAIMNKKSNNVMARQLFLTLGAKILGAPGSLEKSRQVINEWLAGKNINTRDSFVDNGSGLSRESALSAGLLCQLLTDAAHKPYARDFMDTLSIAGVDGTMRNRFINHPAQGKLYVKTGTLNGVRAIAGYVNSQSGKQYTIAMIQQHPGVENGRGKAVQNAVLDWVYRQ